MATVVPEVIIAKAGAVVCGDNYELATLGASSVPPVSLVASYLRGTNNKFVVTFMITDGQDNIHPFAWMGSLLSDQTGKDKENRLLTCAFGLWTPLG